MRESCRDPRHECCLLWLSGTSCALITQPYPQPDVGVWGAPMTKQLIAALLISATTLAVQPASAADIPVKAPPPVAVVASGGFFFSVTGGYYFDDPNKDIFISPNNGGGGGVNCCGAGLGDGWGGRGLVGYRWSLVDVAVGYEHAKFSKGDPQRSYNFVGSPLHAPDGRYWTLDGEIGLNVMLGSAKARVFAVRVMSNGG